MKTITKVLILLVVCALLIAANAPPKIPSSFWGYVNGGKSGQTVAVYVNNVKVAWSTTELYQGLAVYSVDVPMDKYPDGTLASFRVNGIAAGSGKLYSGTNQRLDLKVVYWFWRR